MHILMSLTNKLPCIVHRESKCGWKGGGSAEKRVVRTCAYRKRRKETSGRVSTERVREARGERVNPGRESTARRTKSE